MTLVPNVGIWAIFGDSVAIRNAAQARRGASSVQIVRTCSATIASGMPAIDAQKNTVSIGAPEVAVRMRVATSSGVPTVSYTHLTLPTNREV